MTLSPLAVLLLVCPAGISVLFYLRGQQLPLVRRIAASAHGLLVALILLIAGVVAANQPVADSVLVVFALYGCPALAILSMIYSMRALREIPYIHLLHLVTIASLFATLTIAALVVGGPW